MGTNLSAFNAAADNAANDTRQRWLINFTHNVEAGNTAPGTYDTNQDTLGSHLNYVYNTYGKGGIDNVWFAPSDEVVQYMLVREYATVIYQGEAACSEGLPTPGYTATFTPTSIQMQTDNQQPVISNVIIYPNPCNPGKEDLKINFELTGLCKLMKVKIYTSGFRLIKQITQMEDYDVGKNKINIERKYIEKLSNGIYYLIMEGTDVNDEKLISKPAVIVILS
jgi:hypothetical protein